MAAGFVLRAVRLRRESRGGVLAGRCHDVVMRNCDSVLTLGLHAVGKRIIVRTLRGFFEIRSILEFGYGRLEPEFRELRLLVEPSASAAILCYGVSVVLLLAELLDSVFLLRRFLGVSQCSFGPSEPIPCLQQRVERIAYAPGGAVELAVCMCRGNRIEFHST